MTIPHNDYRITLLGGGVPQNDGGRVGAGSEKKSLGGLHYFLEKILNFIVHFENLHRFYSPLFLNFDLH